MNRREFALGCLSVGATAVGNHFQSDEVEPLPTVEYDPPQYYVLNRAGRIVFTSNQETIQRVGDSEGRLLSDMPVSLKLDGVPVWIVGSSDSFGITGTGLITGPNGWIKLNYRDGGTVLVVGNVELTIHWPEERQ